MELISVRIVGGVGVVAGVGSVVTKDCVVAVGGVVVSGIMNWDFDDDVFHHIHVASTCLK